MKTSELKNASLPRANGICKNILLPVRKRRFKLYVAQAKFGRRFIQNLNFQLMSGIILNLQPDGMIGTE